MTQLAQRIRPRAYAIVKGWNCTQPRCEAQRFRENRNARQASKGSLYRQGQTSLLLPCISLAGTRNKSSNWMRCNSLDLLFPRIAAAFPEVAGKSVDFGRNLQKSRLETQKFADKFAEAGKFTRRAARSCLSFSETVAASITARKWAIIVRMISRRSAMPDQCLGTFP